MRRSIGQQILAVLFAVFAIAGCGTVNPVVKAGQARSNEGLTKADLAMLSFQISQQVQPEPALIEQIGRHMIAIAGKEPRVVGLVIRQPFDARELTLTVEEATAALMAAGGYNGWSQLHSGLHISTVRVSGQVVTIGYTAMYNIPALVLRYKELPGVLSADPVWNVGDGSWIYIQRRGSEWHYIVDFASGDCIAGCANHELTYFVFDTAGTIQRNERWIIPSAGVPPAWVQQWREQRYSR